MKKLLTFMPYAPIDQLPVDESAFIEDDLYLSGFKKTSYQSLEFDLCIDGELYNTEEITKELILANFKAPTCLEEVFLYSYLLWGNEAMRKLEGSYSFTIRKGKTILSIKDPMGTKPIFYMSNKKGIWVSNSIDTILEYSEEPAVLNKDGIIELFAFGPSLSESETLFKDIKALPMGSILSLRDHKVQVERYYDLPLYKHEDSLEDTIAKVHDLVHDSVINQSKDCKASFLSGGVDSSIITSICTKNNPDWHTYSLDYEGNSENFKGNMYQVSLDQEYIDEMLAYCKNSHTKLTITQKELLDALDEAMLARNMPGMGDVDSSLLWLCEQVAKEEKIILSGECGDEVFGGYPWFYREEFKDIQTFPWLRYSEQRIQLLNKRIQDFDYQGYVDKRYLETLAIVKYLDSDSEEDKKARLNTVLVLHWFMQTLVTRQVCEGDKAKVNIRAPFANVKLLEYVYNIPWSMKFLNDEEKGILRKAFEDELPTKVAHRKKNPFPKTHNPLYADLIAEKVKERFDDPNSPLHVLFDDEKLKELIDTKGASYTLPWYGQLMSGPQLLSYIYQIDRWICEYHVTIE
ncbi:asparagine synthetase B family protein [Amedibacillus sp. YH-ame6]